MKREHKWNREDTIITLYFAKYGVKNLPLKDEKELAETIIGSSLDSLKMQTSNVEYVLGKKQGTLKCFSKLQKQIVSEFKGKSESEVLTVVIDIMSNGERKEMVTERIKVREQTKKEDKDKEEKKKLDAIFRKMGKDPSKMRSIGTRPKED